MRSSHYRYEVEIEQGAAKVAGNDGTYQQNPDQALLGSASPVDERSASRRTQSH